MIAGSEEEGKNSDLTNKYLDVFLGLIPEYCVDKNRQLLGVPEEWQPRIISYSLYLGLGIGSLDGTLARKLLAGMSPGMKQTSDLVLVGMREVKSSTYDVKGHKWGHAVTFLSNFMSMTSPETTGKGANEVLVKQRAPITGFLPALRLSVEDEAFGIALFSDAIGERRECDDEELAARIDWMSEFAAEMIEST